MRIFLYEFVTGGGFLADASLPPASLLREGQAMIGALEADFLAIDSLDVVTLRDRRLASAEPSQGRRYFVSTEEEEAALFDELASQADGTMVIAPEFDGLLLDRARRVEAVGGRLISPGPELVALASDKQRSAEHLQAAGVPVPRGRRLAAGEPPPRDFAYPAVLKPIDGAGSQGLSLLNGAAAALAPAKGNFRIEQFCPGLAVSVAVLSGPMENVVLPPCCQRLSDDGAFHYLGGSLLLDEELVRRARKLARRVVDSLPEPRGYVGIDMVLGDAPSGSGDVVIEINPRLTTSYVGLRAATTDNLAAALLEVASGRPASLSFRREPLQFDADGTVVSCRSVGMKQ